MYRIGKIFFILFIMLLIIIIGCPVINEKSGNDPASPFLFPKRIAGIYSEYGESIAADNSGNIITIGYVQGNIDFNGDGDLSDEGETRTAGFHGMYDIIIIKHNSSGNFLWAKRLGGENNDCGFDVAADSNNNIIITGYVTDNADLNGDGDMSDTNETVDPAVFDNQDIILLKFNSGGDLIWSKRLGGTDYEEGDAVAVDNDDRITVAGRMSSDGDLNGDGTINHGGLTNDDDETQAAPYGNSDIFTIQFDSDGAFYWMNRFGGADSDTAKSIAVDNNNNIFIVGDVSENADLNSDGNTSGAYSTTGETAGSVSGSSDMVVIKLNFSGIYQWSRRMGGNDGDSAVAAAADQSGNIIITGYVYEDADLDFNDNTISRNAEIRNSVVTSLSDVIAVKLSASGSYLWARRIGGSYGDYGCGTSVDTDGNAYISGIVSEIADLNGDGDKDDGGAENPSGTHSTTDADIFISKFDSDGVNIWTKRYGGYSSEICGNSVFTNNKIFITGKTESDADLNGDGDFTDTYEPDTAVYDNSDIFIIYSSK